VGNFKVKIHEKARYVDAQKCTGCGDCETACPVSFLPYYDLPSPKLEIEQEREAVVSRVMARYEGERGSLLPIMIEVNQELGWLPQDVLRYLSRSLDTPLSQLLRLATFYNFFSLVPRGRHTINVCLGTGCFIKGGKAILSKLERSLAIKAGESTPDLRFSLEVVRCLGCCALAPVVGVNDDIHHIEDPDRLPEVLAAYE
jgi:NADH:ubiquinone oxidoreductase subunit E